MILDERGWAPIWKEILVRDQLRCVYCGFDGSKDVHAFRQLVASGGLDHLVPTTQGGLHSVENLVLCCWPCNKLKGSYDPRPDVMPADSDEKRKVMIEKVREYLKPRDWDYYQRVLDEALQLSGKSAS